MINIVKSEGVPRDNIDFKDYQEFVLDNEHTHKKISVNKYFKQKLSELSSRFIGETDRGYITLRGKDCPAITYSLGCYGYKNIKNLITWYFGELKKIEEHPKFIGWFVRRTPKIEKDDWVVCKCKGTPYRIYGRLIPIYD